MNETSTISRWLDFLPFQSDFVDWDQMSSDCTETINTSGQAVKTRGARFIPIRIIGKSNGHRESFVQHSVDTTTGKHVAIKYIKRGWDQEEFKYVLREVLTFHTLSQFKHPHIVELFEVFLTPRFLGLAMELVEGPNLQDYLEQQGGPLPEDTARFIFQQLVVAVDFCHRQGKVNRDINLSNILVLPGRYPPLIKLCDFGFSKDKTIDSIPKTLIGSLAFSAPEIFQNGRAQPYDGEAADVYACGVVLFMLLFGRHPYLPSMSYAHSKEDQVVALMENAIARNLQMPAQANAHVPAMHLLMDILVPSPECRLKVHQIQSHPWFTHALPPGAAMLNQLYMNPQVVAAGAAQGGHHKRQTPQQVRQIVTAAASPALPVV